MLDQMTVPELKKQAKELGIKNADSMKKLELVIAIQNFAAASQGSAESSERSRTDNSDYLKHPKFAKFIPAGDTQHD